MWLRFFANTGLACCFSYCHLCWRTGLEQETVSSHLSCCWQTSDRPHLCCQWPCCRDCRCLEDMGLICQTSFFRWGRCECVKIERQMVCMCVFLFIHVHAIPKMQVNFWLFTVLLLTDIAVGKTLVNVSKFSHLLYYFVIFISFSVIFQFSFNLFSRHFSFLFILVLQFR